MEVFASGHRVLHTGVPLRRKVGLEHDPNNKELKKLAEEIDLRRLEHQQREAQVSRAVAGAKDLVSAIEDRGLKIGKAMFQELTRLRKPTLDNNNILHWPVLLLYAEVMSSDFIEDFYTCPPLPWDKENNYTRESIELYYEAGSGVCLSKSKLLRYLLEGTATSHVESIDVDEKDTTEGLNHGISSGEGSKWVKVGEKRTLHNVLKEPNFIIPGIPVFYVVSKRSSFYKEFKAGKWVPPP
ncbi:tetratricopeptide repeat protein 4 like protein [Quercus suber]|uniref:Tetratricopeptide repeat protein 4 like protein n=1 Tax=Quercus suber TaxID=58331 RepID=A0AAW0KYL9_QUESU